MDFRSQEVDTHPKPLELPRRSLEPSDWATRKAFARLTPSCFGGNHQNGPFWALACLRILGVSQKQSTSPFWGVGVKKTSPSWPVFSGEILLEGAV